jgi:phage terminase large subunit GpA-like protein
MQAMSSSDPCEEVVLMFSSQSGKTEVINNCVGYAMAQDPGPIMVIQPSEKPMGHAWAKDRLAPMLRDTPALKNLVFESGRRDSDNTILHKVFPGGHLTVVGANSTAGLASRPIRYLLMDEVDRHAVTREGDAGELAKKRTVTFWNRKILAASSPTYEDSGIHFRYHGCDARYQWQLRCQHCEALQFPTLKHFQWKSDDPASAVYVCESCGAIHDHEVERFVKAGGAWVCIGEDGAASKGFHFNQWSSPFVRWADTVAEFLSAKDDAFKLQVVTNTYDHAPDAVEVVTFGCDVQVDRLECNVWGWDRDEQGWDLDYKVIYGDPEGPAVWDKLTEYLKAGVMTESGLRLSIHAGCVDSGYCASQVGRFTQRYRHVFSTKGASTARSFIEPIKMRARRARNNPNIPRSGVRPELIGVDEGKLILYHRLRMTQPGPRYLHFKRRDAEYFAQLTAHAMIERMQKGKTVRKWEQTRDRDEVADTWILALAAVRLRSPDWDQLAAARERQVSEKKVAPKRRISSRSSFISR